MKLYEIVVKSEFDDGFCKTILVMCSEPLTIDSEAVKAMANVDEEWGEYIDQVHQKKVHVCASGEEEASDIFAVLSLFGQ